MALSATRRKIECAVLFGALLLAGCTTAQYTVGSDTTDGGDESAVDAPNEPEGSPFFSTDSGPPEERGSFPDSPAGATPDGH